MRIHTFEMRKNQTAENSIGSFIQVQELRCEFWLNMQNKKKPVITGMRKTWFECEVLNVKRKMKEISGLSCKKTNLKKNLLQQVIKILSRIRTLTINETHPSRCKLRTTKPKLLNRQILLKIGLT